MTSSGCASFTWVGAFLSPDGALVNSQGREPLEIPAMLDSSPEGAEGQLSPLRGLEASGLVSRGSRPWLFTVAPLGLKEPTPFNANPPRYRLHTLGETRSHSFIDFLATRVRMSVGMR